MPEMKVATQEEIQGYMNGLKTVGITPTDLMKLMGVLRGVLDAQGASSVVQNLTRQKDEKMAALEREITVAQDNAQAAQDALDQLFGG